MTSSSSRTGQEFLAGCFGGLVGQATCHPFDTAKTRIQAHADLAGYSFVRDLRRRGLISLWQGLPPPLTSVIVEKSLLFSSYDFFRHRLTTGQQPSAFQAGILAGLLTTLTVTPFERIKIKAQNDLNSNRATQRALQRVITHDGLFSLYRGWSMTLLREVPGYGLYFWAYEHSRQHWLKFNQRTTTTATTTELQKQSVNNLKPWQAFVTGSISGVTAWIFIYPSDPIKTMSQDRNISPRVAIERIWKQKGFRGFYQGYIWGLFRAGVLHGGVFLGYESAKQLINFRHLSSFE